MYLATVIGTVVATSKDQSLTGKKLLIVARLSEKLKPTGETEIAADSVGAGNGETVIVSQGSSARFTGPAHETVIDSSIVGIVDSVEIVGNL
ncbi:MAG: EutN/CcmL family microcompartment protein [Deltaproteobacteria bacterium]|jgi:ethanolamine utilization protein EutN|nr:EutN/CcmL family microcompartment protein [Deltaproteobacteria bacterium]